MGKPIFKRSSEAVIRGEGATYKIANFITKEITNKVSLAVSELHGSALQTMNTVSDRIYYFLEGNAIFDFEDKKIKVEKDSVLYVPANTPYKMSGNFKAILINSPAFNVSDEIHEE
ncbi:MAG: hypothetical protein PHW01_01245 [Patescibacteria group bacterium]|nr:hypothetical protein [Patescibacteria group bacterium]